MPVVSTLYPLLPESWPNQLNQFRAGNSSLGPCLSTTSPGQDLTKKQEKNIQQNFHEKEHKHVVEAGLSLSFTISGSAHLVTFWRHPDILLLHFTMGRYEWVDICYFKSFFLALIKDKI